mmetsp:Transcript_41750/g.120995  ORF Transcript_41750/g.120995 Transcript_41750/m.120995 type:complete len:184 (-) Transcript_41750:25-576(-)
MGDVEVPPWDPATASLARQRAEEESEWTRGLCSCRQRGALPDKVCCCCLPWCCSCLVDGGIGDFLDTGVPVAVRISPLCCASCMLQYCLPVLGCLIRAACIHYPQRKKLHDHFIKGHSENGCFIACCCPCCSTAQTYDHFLTLTEMLKDGTRTTGDFKAQLNLQERPQEQLNMHEQVGRSTCD